MYSKRDIIKELNKIDCVENRNDVNMNTNCVSNILSDYHNALVTEMEAFIMLLNILKDHGSISINNVSISVVTTAIKEYLK